MSSIVIKTKTKQRKRFHGFHCISGVSFLIHSVCKVKLCSAFTLKSNFLHGTSALRVGEVYIDNSLNSMLLADIVMDSIGVSWGSLQWKPKCEGNGNSLKAVCRSRKYGLSMQLSDDQLYPEIQRQILQQCFLTFNMHINHLRILLQCRFWIDGGGGGREWVRKLEILLF